MIELCTSIEQPGWLSLREMLWPDCSREDHLTEMAHMVENPAKFAQFVAYSVAHEAVGFVEASLRTDYVNGTKSTPVVFLEGVYVLPAERRSGIGARLVAEVENWARSLGCSELASDAELDNRMSHAFHRSIGFEETERVVFFRKEI